MSSFADQSQFSAIRLAYGGEDDRRGEDRHGWPRPQAGAVLAAWRTTAPARRRGSGPLGSASAPMIARAEWVAARPTTVVAALDGLGKGPGIGPPGG